MAIDPQVQKHFSLMLGESCCRQRVWRSRSLSLGFGKKIQHGNPKLVDDYYGEWEIGTFRCGWRVTEKGKIICASDDTVDSIDELDSAVKRINFGRIQSVIQPTHFDIRAQFDTGIAIEFLGTISDEDECFFIFCPQKVHIGFSIKSGWIVGESGIPGGN